MRVTKEYLRNVIKESIEEVASAAAAEYELEELEEAEDKEPSTTAIFFGNSGKYHGQIKKDGTGTFQDPKGKTISQADAMKVSGYHAAMKRAAAKGYGTKR
jgi:hypothetical protein